MSAFVIDSSALIAVLTGEAESGSFIQLLDAAHSSAISAATLHEAYCVAGRHAISDGRNRLERMIELIAPEIAPFDSMQLAAARLAYSRYGRGSGHAAQLNMGDCFAYALARTRNLPLLFKGDDFVHTDIEPALTPV